MYWLKKTCFNFLIQFKNKIDCLIMIKTKFKDKKRLS